MSAPRFKVPEGFFDEGGPLPRTMRLDIREVTPSDPEFPDLLRQIPEPPSRLWVAGRDLREMQPGVAVIGSRAANGYGIRVATDLAADLAGSRACVVSGLARGIDAAAHDGALSAGGATIAVLGCGVDLCYPHGSRTLYAEIAARGTLVSEVPPGTQIRRNQLLRRNDILAGLCVAVVVVQGVLVKDPKTNKKSAAVATAERAGEWGREVFAVPGLLDWQLSTGPHHLLEHGAAVCTGAGSISARLAEHIRYEAPVDRPIPEHLPEAQKSILRIVSAGAVTVERAIVLAGLGVDAGCGAIGALELDGYLRSAGGLIRRVR